MIKVLCDTCSAPATNRLQFNYSTVRGLNVGLLQQGAHYPFDGQRMDTCAECLVSALTGLLQKWKTVEVLAL